MSRSLAIGRSVISLAIVGVIAVAVIAYFSYTNPGGPPSIVSSSRSTSGMSTVTFCGGSPCGGNRTAGSSQSGVSTTTCVTTTQAGQRIVNCFSPTLTSTVTSTICGSITGQPAGAFLRVLSDSTQAPVIGAVVTARLNSMGCLLNGVVYVYTPTVQSFTTNGTTWILLNTTNGADFSFTVQYLGQSYNFTAGLRPVSETCATLYVPSGRNNVTITGLHTTCP